MGTKEISGVGLSGLGVLDGEVSKASPFADADLRYGIIEVTRKCQLACPGCYMVSRGDLNDGTDGMSLDDAVEVLDKCKGYRGKELESMDILGGEPLLWPNLKPYVDELVTRGIRPWIFSNLLAMTSDMARWLRSRNVTITGKLNINPDDPSQYPLQAKMLGRNGASVAKMLDGVRALQEAGYDADDLRLENLVRKENIAQVIDYYRWCLDNNVGVDIEVMGSSCGFTPEYFEVAPNAEELADMIRGLQRVRVERDLEPLRVLMPHIFSTCRFSANGLYFGADGEIRPCSNSSARLGNIRDENAVKKAYESPLFKNRLCLSASTIGEPCSSCEVLGECTGGCRATVEGDGDPFAGWKICPRPLLAKTGRL